MQSHILVALMLAETGRRTPEKPTKQAPARTRLTPVVWASILSMLFTACLSDSGSENNGDAGTNENEEDTYIRMTVAETPLNFGNAAVGNALIASFPISNSSNSDGPLTGSVSVSGSESFSLTRGEGAFAIPPGASDTVTVRFAPTAPESYTGLLAIRHNATNFAFQDNNPVFRTLEGTGITPGSVWTERDAGRNGDPFFGVLWSPPNFIAIGESFICFGGCISDGGDVYIASSTGRTWEFAASTADALYDIIRTDSRLVAVGEKGQIYTSTDNGSSWGSYLFYNNHLHSVTEADTQFVAVGEEHIVRFTFSEDRINRTFISTGGIARYSVAWSGSRLVMVGEDGSISTSVDGAEWEAQSSGTTNTLRGVEWLNSQFVAVGDNGTVLTSPDGLSWTAQSSGATDTLYAVTGSDAKYVAVGSEGRIITSPDAQIWSPATSNTSSSLRGVAWSGTRFVAASASGIIVTSP